MIEPNPFDGILDPLAMPPEAPPEEPREPREPRPSTDPDKLPHGEKSIIFDIETGPEPEERLRELFAFDSDSLAKERDLVAAEFDPTAVKYGNRTNEAKRKEHLEKTKEKFLASQREAQKKIDTAEQEAWEKFAEKSTLSPVTSQVLAIGYRGAEKTVICGQQPGGGNEASLLAHFWQTFCDCRDHADRLIGFNIFRFDLPFLVRRSWKHGIDVPPDAYSYTGTRVQWHRCFVDLLSVWRLGNHSEYISLADLAKYLGDTQKSGDGSKFHKLWNGTPDEHSEAVAYLENDVLIPQELARIMGVL